MKKLGNKYDFFPIILILIVCVGFLGTFIPLNYEFLSLGLAAILVMVTRQYTQLTGELASETTKMRKAQTQPNVYVAIQPVDELNEIMEFFIQNIGLGPAYDIIFIDPPVFQYSEFKSEKKLLSKVHLIENGIEFLAPNQKMQVFMMQSFEVFKLNPKDPINIKIRYADNEREEFERDYKIDFSIVKDVQRLKNKYTEFESSIVTNAVAMNKSLSNISSKMDKISDNSIFSTGLIQPDSSELLAATENHNRQVEIAKIMVKKVLIGFLNDWKSYSESNQIWSNEDAEYMEFISMDNRLDYHLYQFILVPNEISATGALPEIVSNKLIDLAARMRVMISKSDIVGADAWGREYPDNLPNQLDKLLADIKDMYENLDKICSAA